MPTRQEVLDLQVGHMALDCFGNLAEVTEIYGRGDDIDGRAFVCYYTRLSANSTVSNSMKEGKIVRTTRLTHRYKSAEIDAMEAQMRHVIANTHTLTCSCGAEFTVVGSFSAGQKCASCMEIYQKS